MRRKSKKYYMIMPVAVLTVCGMFFFGCAGESDKRESITPIEVSEEQKDTEEKKAEKEKAEEESENQGKESVVYVHVCGQVNVPGVYELPEGSRIYEAVAAAGGMTKQAAGERLNQAAAVEDGQQIYVLSKEEVAKDAESAGGEAGVLDASIPGMPQAEDGKVNLNTATAEELMTLSGIGEAKAEAILRYREEHGGFQKVEELMEVEGIKEGVFHKIKEQVKI